MYLLLAFMTGAPFVPSQMARAHKMVELAHIQKNQTIIDLGSGDGRLLFLAAKKGANAIGLEINPYLVWYTRFRAAFSPYRSHIHVWCKNLWKADVSAADVVFVYLLPWRMDELATKLQKELKPGALVVSNSFIFPGWPIVAQDPALHVYAFRIPVSDVTQRR